MPRKKAAKKKTVRKQKPKPRATATTKWVSFRLPHRTLAQIEQYQKWLSKDFGLPINRTTALVHLVRRCMEKTQRDRKRRGPTMPSRRDERHLSEEHLVGYWGSSFGSMARYSTALSGYAQASFH